MAKRRGGDAIYLGIVGNLKRDDGHLAPAVIPFFQPKKKWNDRLRQVAALAGYVFKYSQKKWFTTTTLCHAWSLSVEEQFYFLWPVLLYEMLCWLPRRRVLTIVIGGILASAALRAYLHNQHRFLGTQAMDRMLLYSGLHTRADALL